MRQLVRLGTAGLFIAVLMLLAAAPAGASHVLVQSAAPAPVLDVPDLPLLPLPEPSVPSIPVPEIPLPEVPLPEPPDVPDVVDVPDASVPRLSPPTLSSPQPAARAPEQSDQSKGQDGQAAAGTPVSANRKSGAAAVGTSDARPVVAQVDNAELSRASGVADDLLLDLVHDELCTALASLLVPMPDTVNGLPSRVIAQLPAEVVNVVPQSVLARATIRCSSAEPTGAGPGPGSADDGPLTGVLGLHPLTGLQGAAALPLGLALLSIGIGLRFVPASNAQSEPA